MFWSKYCQKNKVLWLENKNEKNWSFQHVTSSNDFTYLEICYFPFILQHITYHYRCTSVHSLFVTILTLFKMSWNGEKICYTSFYHSPFLSISEHFYADFHKPRAHLQVATGYLCLYVTSFCYLSLCEPMSAWISPYLTVLVFVSTNQRASSRKA